MSALMIFVGLLFVLTAILSFAGWIWLVVRGFKTSAGWGIAMLLVAPIAAIVAAVKDWQSWKKPFLMYWGSFGVQVVLLIVIMVAMPMAFVASGGQAELAKAMEQAQRQAQSETAAQGDATPSTEPERIQMAAGEEPPAHDTPADGGAQDLPAGSHDKAPAVAETHPLTDPAGRPASASVTDHSTRPSAKTTDDETAVPPGFEVVPVSSAASRTGSKVRLIDLDGRIHSGVLMSVENGELQVRFDLGAGSVVTGFDPKEIQSLQVAQAK